MHAFTTILLGQVLLLSRSTTYSQASSAICISSTASPNNSRCDNGKLTNIITSTLKTTPTSNSADYVNSLNTFFLRENINRVDGQMLNGWTNADRERELLVYQIFTVKSEKKSEI